LDKPELQDNPKVWWDEDAITAVVKEYVAKWKVDVVSIFHPKSGDGLLTLGGQILTFDSGGVSGHINHRAVSAAVRYVFGFQRGECAGLSFSAATTPLQTPRPLQPIYSQQPASPENIHFSWTSH
jgi:LmbE family N-acetylglucosaminyl deacetylase